VDKTLANSLEALGRSKMKINEVINEAGFWKGVAKAIAPQTVQTYDRQKNALRTPQTAGDSSMAKYDKFADIIAQRASSGIQITDQYVASQLPRSGETGNEQKRWEVTQYVIDRLKRGGINVIQKPQTPMPMGLKRLIPSAKQEPIKVGDEIIQPSDPRYAKIMQTIK